MEKIMKNCIIPGSYDPVTKGHIELFETASKIFDRVYPVILANAEKSSGMFSYDERLEIIRCAIEKMKERGIVNVEPVKFSGLTTDAACSLGASFVVKGVRNLTDFAYEYDLSQITRRFDSSLETVFIPSKAELACVSSTYVRELIKYGDYESVDYADGTCELIRKLYVRK